MRHLAWLHAVPEGKKKTRLKAYTEMSEEHSSLRLPVLDGAEYLVQLVHEAGLATSNGMGTMPLSWTEIESWITCSERLLTSWEIATVKVLSETYVAELNQASDKNRPHPYVFKEDVKVNREVVATRLKGFLSNFNRVTPPPNEN